jgi:KDO2-lipid IV(A) lauroyltransferase
MMLRQLRFVAEDALVGAGLALLKALGPVRASNFAGAVARGIGPLLPVSRVAHANLRLAMPELDAAARRRVVRGVWDNLGRTVGELPHLQHLRRTDSGPGWEVAGDLVLQSVRAQGGTCIFVSGHIGNWEMLPPIAPAVGFAMSGFYRAAANPLVDARINALRRAAMGIEVPMFAKGAEGARGAFGHLRGGGCLGILVDQKLNDGISVPFFGHPAMTAPAAAAFALRFRCPLLFVHIERVGPARLRLVCRPPFALPDSGDRAADIASLTTEINRVLEGVIRSRPEAWLWLHRRWPKEAYRDH